MQLSNHHVLNSKLTEGSAILQNGLKTDRQTVASQANESTGSIHIATGSKPSQPVYCALDLVGDGAHTCTFAARTTAVACLAQGRAGGRVMVSPRMQTLRPAWGGPTTCWGCTQEPSVAETFAD